MYFCDLLSALGYIHSKGIVHRDVKLENCLLDSQGHLKLADFGLSNVYVNGPLQTSCGSVDYAAPELFGAEPYYGPPVDVWAAGVVLFALVTSIFPFDNVPSILQLDYAFPPTIQLSPSVMSLIRGIFQRKPEFRLTVQQTWRHEWIHGSTPKMARSTSSVSSELSHYKTSLVQDRLLGRSKVIEQDPLVVRPDLLAVMEHDHGSTPEAVVESLFSGEINQFTATYKMLESKYPQPVTVDEAELKVSYSCLYPHFARPAHYQTA